MLARCGVGSLRRCWVSYCGVDSLLLYYSDAGPEAISPMAIGLPQKFR